MYAAEEYSGRAGSDSVGGYVVDQSTGAVSTIPGLPLTLAINKEVYSASMHPAGNYLYLTGTAEIYAFAIDQNTGSLAQVAGSPYPTVDDAGSQIALAASAVSSKGDLLVGLDGQNRVWVYKIEQTSGALTRLPRSYAAGSRPTEPARNYYVASCDCMATHPSGKFLYVASGGSNDVSGFAINSDGTLSPTPGSPYPAGISPSSIEVDGAGKFAYVANYSSNTISIYRIDASTGTLTAQGTAATGQSPIWLDIDRDGKFVFTANWGSKSFSAFQADGTTGVLVPVTGSPFSGDPDTGYVLTISTPRRK